jgi:hypothetical protein
MRDGLRSDEAELVCRTNDHIPGNATARLRTYTLTRVGEVRRQHSLFPGTILQRPCHQPTPRPMSFIIWYGK